MKRIAVINDLSGFGRCSLSAALPIISVMGHEACPLPTAVLSNQTGYESYYCDDYTDKMSFFNEQWKKICPVFDAIYSGYIANEKQVDYISSFIESFSDETTILLVDPVMGDDGKLYDSHNTAICEGIKTLVKKSNVICPNLTELCILTGRDYSSISQMRKERILEEIKDMSSSLISDKLRLVITTGIINDNMISSTIYSEGKFEEISNERIGESFSGTGDIFASIVVSSLLSGFDPYDAVKKATDFISMSLTETLKHEYDRNDGIDFQKFLKRL